MTVSHPINIGSEKFDIAFSFVSRTDLRFVTELRELLQTEFSVFLPTDHQQLATGGEGVTAYSKVFRRDTRLAVILLRADWGKTPMTTIEEAAIRERAARVGYRSFMLVAMEEDVERPEWTGATVCHPGWLETRDGLVAAITTAAREARRTLGTRASLQLSTRALPGM